MKPFVYLPEPQRSPEWFSHRSGKVSASQLWRLMARSKRDGSPLQECKNYLAELAFERAFGRSIEIYVTAAMEDGINFESFAVEEYKRLNPKAVVEECGAWGNDLFVASPDRTVGEDGLLEIKILRDNSFLQVLEGGVIDKHNIQIQGQLWATDRKWCDYVALNLNTQRFVVLRVTRNEDEIENIKEALENMPELPTLNLDNVHEVMGKAPEPVESSLSFGNNNEDGELSW